MSLLRLDHLVLTVADIDRACRFYESLGMRRETFGEGRTALRFGDHKINLHRAAGDPAEPKAENPGRGTADFCLVVDDLGRAEAEARAAGLAIVEGPVGRTGALGPIRSIYLRDPDGNLVELAHYAAG